MTIKYENECLYFGDINIAELGKDHNTPFYLYSENLILQNLDRYLNQLKTIDSLICYSVKSNSNLSVLSIFAKKGCGFDIVSGGELQRVILAKGNTNKVVFSGVGKTNEEIKFALESKILCFNVESFGELNRINQIASDLSITANVSIRVNPEIDAKTHPYITTGLSENKFGVAQDDVLEIFLQAKKLSNIKITGIDYHIGSQITEIQPFTDAATKVLSVIAELRKKNILLNHVDIGGGLGINYSENVTVDCKPLVDSVVKIFENSNLKLIIEPGRSLVGNTGIIVTKVIDVKRNTNGKKFLIVDAGMNDLIRPPLYNAFHNIKEARIINRKKEKFDVVGPICETADFLGKDRDLATDSNELLVIEDVGAYGFVLASNYNSRPKIPEYMISNGLVKCIRARERFDDMIADEKKYL